MSIPVGVIASQIVAAAAPTHLGHGTSSVTVSWPGTGLLVAYFNSGSTPSDDAGLTWTQRTGSGGLLCTAPVTGAGSATITASGSNFLIVDHYPGASAVQTWTQTTSFNVDHIEVAVSGSSASNLLGYYGSFFPQSGTLTGLSLPSDKTAVLSSFAATLFTDAGWVTSGYSMPAADSTKTFTPAGGSFTADSCLATIIEISGVS